MPDIDEDKIKQFIRKAAARQMPDAWGGIERSVSNMENTVVKAKAPRRRFALAAALASCAVLVLAAAAFAWPGFLLKGDDTQVRQPTPFSTSASLTPEKGPPLKIRVYESLGDLATADSTTDIAEFEFVREIGAEPSADGMALYTSYEMRAVKVFKGGLKPGDTVTVRTFGGANDGKWIEDDFVERFTGKFGYVLFLSAPEAGANGPYGLASRLQGYVPLLRGRVSLNTKIEGNGLFSQGETIAELSAAIEEALR
jgi:hypothetical protein